MRNLSAPARLLLAALLVIAATGSASAALPASDSSPSALSGGSEAGASPRVITPHIVSMPSVPDESWVNGRVLTTPRARLFVRPRVSDPREIVERSGRRGCLFSLKSVISGIVEFLFPGGGFFRRGDPLFRIYDPAILVDLSAAEQALRNYDVQPLLIAAAPRRRATPSPQTDTAPARPQLTREQPRAASPPPDRPTPKPKAAQPQKPKAALQPAARVKPAAPAPPKVNLGPYEKALDDAQEAFGAAQRRLSQCQEDYEAKKKLFELGALSQQSLDASAQNLTDAMMSKADAQARQSAAQDVLAGAKKRAADAANSAREAAPAPECPPQVEIVRGPIGGSPETEVQVVPEHKRVRVESGVEVIRGIDTPKPERRPRETAVAAKPKPASEASRVSRTTATRSPAGSLRDQRQSGQGEYTPNLVTRRFPATPKELDRLGEKRWTEYQAPADGFALETSVIDGELIEPGAELLKVINTQWALSYFVVARQDVDSFLPGTIVTVTFDDYPDVIFEGWVNSLEPDGGHDALRAEIVVFCRSGYYGTDAFATLQWLALATPLEESNRAEPVEPVIENSRRSLYERDPAAPLSLVSPDVWGLRIPDEELSRSDTEFQGQLQLVEFASNLGPRSTEGEDMERLSRLKRWREGFVDGMTRTVFDKDVILTYPKSGEIRQAIERMSTSRVTHIPNRCARTMREALGWGLGDAHVWARQLPSRGYVARRDGLARPGDILVWPFTYGPRRTQHIGIAVQQNGRLMLLSNLSGRLGTTEVLPGYAAFYKPNTG